MRAAGAGSAIAAAVLLAWPGAAQAAVVRMFRLPAEPLEQALVRFAAQGEVSVGGLPAAGCSGSARAVLGPMTPAQALARLLPKGCSFQQVDARAFRIVSAAPAGRLSAVAAPASALGELIVTAEKRPEPLIGSPYAVSALSGAELHRLGDETFSQAALDFVGVAVTNLGPGRDKVFVRGLSDGVLTGRTQSVVGLYLDDAPITYGAPDPDLRLIDLARVEVLRGPQGTLYGSGSVGGVVHIVTAAPDPTALSGSLRVGGGVTEHGRPSNEVDAVLNLPLTQAAALRAVVYSDSEGGYLDNPRLGLAKANEARRWGARVSALDLLPDGWRVRASFVHQSIDTSDAQYTEGGAGSFTRETQVIEPSDNDFTEGALTVARTGQAIDLKLSAAVVDHDLESQYDATGAFPAAAGAEVPAAFDETQKVTLTVLEATAASAGAGRTQWLVGAFGSEAREVDTGSLATAGAVGAIPAYRQRTRLQELAVYGEAAYALTGRLTLTGGLRWFATHSSSHASDFGLAGAPAAALDGEVTDRGFAPKLRVSYALAAASSVYAEAQKGYRAGGFSLPPSAGGGATFTGPLSVFAGDSLWNYELGAVAPLFGRRLSLRVAIFHMDWHRLQSDELLPSGLPVTVNIGDGVDNGVETEARWRDGPHWEVRANALFADPQVLHVSSRFPVRLDAGLPGVAGQMETAEVLYRWTPRQATEASLSAGLSYVGRSHASFDAAPASEMGGYALARLVAEVARGPWRLAARLDNATGEVGDTFAFGNPFSQGRLRQVTPLRPRTLRLDLARSF
jgi:outer membrane receptor protein involved in Fe transport